MKAGTRTRRGRISTVEATGSLVASFAKDLRHTFLPKRFSFLLSRSVQGERLAHHARAWEMGWGSHYVDKPDASADMRTDECRAVAPLPLLPPEKRRLLLLPPAQKLCQAPSPSSFCVTRVVSEVRGDRVSPLCRTCFQTICHMDCERQGALDRAQRCVSLRLVPHRRATQCLASVYS